jgi:plasmid stability protein
MATLTIRNVPTKVVRALKAQAARNRRSMEQEVREIIEAQVGDRASAIAQIERAWASQKRSPKADEIEAWIREGRQ